MAKRRPSGDGMVRKRDDGRWEGRIVVGHKENGDSIFRYVYAKSQKELSAKLRQSINVYQGVDLTEESRMTLSEWLDRWLYEYMAAVLRPGTLNSYRRDMELHVKPGLGQKQLMQITAQDIRKLYDTLRLSGRTNPRRGQSRGLSETTVRGIHNILHRALRTAEEEGLIPSNPADQVAAPRAANMEKKILTDEQLDTSMKAIKRDEFWRVFFYTEVTTGLRRGEICGLKWEDFDQRSGILKVCRTIHREKNAGLTAGDTKTYAGTRKIVLPPSTAKLLKAWRRSAVSEWVFPNPLKPERPIDPGSAYARMKKLLREAGLPDLRFHDLRHTFCTHALASGVDAKTLAGILGHTNASFTLDAYAHVTGDTQRQAADIVGGFLTNILGEELKPWQNEENAAKAAST